MTDPFDGMTAFLAVAETSSFRQASERLGVTRSAVSQTIARLELRIGAPLFQRTTRSVRLTEAGERLLTVLQPARRTLEAALETIGDAHGAPAGVIRIAVSSIAERILEGRLFATFLEAFPQIELGVWVTDDEFDIVGAGFDAGVRLGEVIEADMIAVPVSAPQRQVVVASPGFVARCGVPASPGELIDYDCIGWRPAPGTAPYRWEFADDGRSFDVAVNPRTTTNDMRLMINLALAGAGITFGMEETFRPYVARGELQVLLEAFCPLIPGFYLYFPSGQKIPAKLRALVDHVRSAVPAWPPKPGSS
ncbi:LysR family transcriptional regulator [Paraburkholderia acidicola]|uniref:LysR family transcriptional regulator n=1 Tax=Paraburkholderia acidicola TaxID=1912599 RepID=A0A2A4ESD0_9BURK|nr:LysR family transcriptional regulator [Paraburkholderia acidicola]PCE23330.1 LysR family transcriptional regulator [Paraburkholderia acidicola]